MRRPKSFLLVLVVLIATVALLLQTRPGRQLADRTWSLVDRADRFMRGRWGLPLRGTPDYAKLPERLQQKGARLGAPIFIRIFKKESELELWVKQGKEYLLFQTYPICVFSGNFGPKLKQGDRQAPEGFYTVGRGQLNPNSKYYRSFNLGYPNIFDRAHRRTGNYLMVHGDCLSVGCYAMTDEGIGEIWKFVTAALKGGQRRFHVHAFPFRMTEHNMDLYRDHDWADFWRDLKPAYDLFDQTRLPPIVTVCRGRYQVARGSQHEAPLRSSCRSVPTS